MPATFAPADSEAFKKHETFFQGFVGAGSVFDGGDLRFPASIPDGTSQTIMFAEAAKSVPWTKPDDIPFDAGKLAPRLGGLSKDGFMVACATAPFASCRGPSRRKPCAPSSRATPATFRAPIWINNRSVESV